MCEGKKVLVAGADGYNRLLSSRGEVLATAVHYPIPLNQQPAVSDSAVNLPDDDRAADKVISLPMHPYLSEQEIRAIVGELVFTI